MHSLPSVSLFLMKTHWQMKVDSVPVDTCANLTLVAAWETHKNHTNGKKDLKVGTFESLVHEVLLLHWIVFSPNQLRLRVMY